MKTVVILKSAKERSFVYGICRRNGVAIIGNDATLMLCSDADKDSTRIVQASRFEGGARFVEFEHYLNSKGDDLLNEWESIQ
jgi:hypothetical protein